MDGNFGWIEIVFFYGIAISFGAWQWWKMDRDLKQIRKEKAEAEAKADGGDDASKE
ncbi:hypothetical protein [Erythrobacter rubeus]|uniref:Heme exporter protein D n=1 Tax=Erythrobacter rubeus TaxID=2760803 RepID=A0ABR8KPL5_9SPHN|nr:hypothetical protein [Erythrobacter rubeus]MBD2841123.1 hypothetical protein [Erythrobacter rubeus]